MTLRLLYVGVGMTGCAHAEGLETWGDRENRCSVSSYEGLERFLESHGPEIVDGSPVVDLRPLDDLPNRVRLAWDAPMCDPNITDDSVDRWQGSDDMGFAPMIAGNYFGARGALAAMTTTTDTPGPYDHVSPWRLARYWSEHGARIGRFENGKVIWQ